MNPLIFHMEAKPNLGDFYLKPVVMFVPHLNYPDMPLSCPACNNPLSHKGWASHPIGRYIHDISCGLYLVQFQYECRNLNCEAKVIPLIDLLESLPAFVRAQFPIVLTHSSGMTKDYLLYLTSDATTGKSLMEIGTLIATMRFNRYLERRVAYTSARDMYNNLFNRQTVIQTTTTLSQISSPIITDSFSDFDDKSGYNESQQQDYDTIVDVFIKYVKHHSDYFQTCMDNMPVPFCLSIDTTYRIRKKTLTRQADSRNFEKVKSNGASFIMGGIIYNDYNLLLGIL